eukprot:2793227-Rhodomonas_salina.3
MAARMYAACLFSTSPNWVLRRFAEHDFNIGIRSKRAAAEEEPEMGGHLVWLPQLDTTLQAHSGIVECVVKLLELEAASAFSEPVIARCTR